METKVFRTVIKGAHSGHKFSENAYVRGRICGFMHLLCDFPNGNKLHGIKVMDDDRILTTKCTQEQYDTFKKHYVTSVKHRINRFN